jgi:hypothetical protein
MTPTPSCCGHGGVVVGAFPAHVFMYVPDGLVGVTLLGVGGHLVTVEAHIGRGLPSLVFTGLPGAAGRGRHPGSFAPACRGQEAGSARRSQETPGHRGDRVARIQGR